MAATWHSRGVYRACRLSLAVIFISGRICGQSDAPVHYYDAAIGKTGPALKAALQSIIRNHVVIPYTAVSTDTWDALKVMDEDPFDANNVLLIYSGLTARKTDQNNGTTGTWEREHLWPQSFGITALNSNSRAKSDLFNLRPIDRNVNGTRGNKYYDSSAAPVSMHPEALGSTYDSNSWEPREEEKGAIARSIFYMAVRYDGSDPDVPDLELSDFPSAATYHFGKLTTLLAWHRQLAVTPPEGERNARIYTDYQHNRNPFIDHPDYAEMVFLGLAPGQAWQRTHFTDAEIAASSISGDEADPDRDGLSNLLEYLFGDDPWQPAGAPMNVSVTAENGAYALTVIYSHNRNATDVAASYEWTADLQSWSGVAPQVVSAVPLTSDAEQVTVRFPAAAGAYFVRVRASR